MKTFGLPAIGLALGTTVYVCLSWFAAAQSYVIDTHSIAGGGGASSGGPFSLVASIGQPDAGPAMSGGAYSMEGGTWSIYAATQTPGGPAISLLRAGDGIELRWPVDGSAGYVLEESGALENGAVWSVVAASPVVANSQNVVTLAILSGNHFFRLRKP